MRTISPRTRPLLWGLAAPLLLLLGACTLPSATPTVNVDAVFTSAAQTIAAQQATQLALTPPTGTPSPTPVPTLSPVATFSFGTSTPGGGVSACDNSTYVADVSVPDGTTMNPGQKFEKKWKLLNSGSCAWSTSYKLVFDSGELMGGTTTFVTVPVPSRSQTDIAVNLTAPTTNGKYTGTWRMQNASSQPFGNFITVVIQVGAGSTSTAGPSPTGTPPTATATVATSASGTVTISGSLNVTDFILNFSGASSTPTVSYSGKDYSFIVASGWSGTVTPSKGNKGNYVFSPASRPYTNVTSDQTGQNYTGAPSTTPTATP